MFVFGAGFSSQAHPERKTGVKNRRRISAADFRRRLLDCVPSKVRVWFGNFKTKPKTDCANKVKDLVLTQQLNFRNPLVVVYITSIFYGRTGLYPLLRLRVYKPFIRSFKSNDRRCLQFPIIHHDIVFSKPQH